MTTKAPTALAKTPWGFNSYSDVHAIMHYLCAQHDQKPRTPNWRRAGYMALAQTTFPDDVHRDLRVAFYCGALIGYEFCLVFDALPTMDRLQADAFFDGAKHGEADRDEDDTADPYVMLDDDDEYEHYEDDDHDEDLPIW